MKNTTEQEEIFSHFTTELSKSIVDYAIAEPFKSSRYIFTWKNGSKQYGHCTHCQNEFETSNLKHKSQVICPECQSQCKVQASGISRKYMVDEVYFVYYEKSVINPEAIIARGIYAIRDYRFDFRSIDTMIQTKALYVFEPGKSKMLHRPHVYFSHMEGMAYVSGWNNKKNVRSELNTSMANKPCYCSYESIKEAVKDTQFQYSTWESYLSGDMVQFFDLFSKYPCIEYLTKMGMKDMVDAKLYGHKTYGAINWNGKTLQKVLRLSKQNLRELRENNKSIGPLALRLFQISKKDRSNLSFAEIYEIIIDYGSQFEDLQIVLRYSTLGRANNYIKKQFSKDPKNKIYYHTFQVLQTWRDYIKDCVRLEMDLTQDNVLFPSNLHQAHQNTIKQVKIKEDAELNKKIQRRLKSLASFCFEYAGLMIRPAADSLELIEEGKALQHCVGTYANRYAKGETNLFVIRKANEPDKPFYTMEIKDNSIVQTRGRKNCLPTKEVKAFIDAFKLAKLTKKPKQRKAKTAERQGVAV
ncbi:PcfJ domain-containing protein [Neobacillus sp. NPDC058068]|uniref:PcfJ domain-containing protein n=1 Tax=Neobacillus sp. NPDC058068 TaxID=3346325 RepID=UPI0036DD7CBA